jgi:hypothetical protein
MRLSAGRLPRRARTNDISRLRNQLINGFINSDFRVCHRFFESVILKLIITHPNKAEVAQTDEPENGFEVRFKKVEMGHCSARVERTVSGGGDDHDRLWLKKRAIGVGGCDVEIEGPADPNDLINVCFELPWHPEVVHGHAENNGIGPYDLIDQRIAQCQGILHRWAAFCRQSKCGGDPGFIDRRRRVSADAARKDFCA